MPERGLEPLRIAPPYPKSNDCPSEFFFSLGRFVLYVESRSHRSAAYLKELIWTRDRFPKLHQRLASEITVMDLEKLLKPLTPEAVRRLSGRDLPVNFEHGDAQALRFPDMSFDAVRCERMLMHVPDASRAVSEMARVARPGGRIVVRSEERRVGKEC